MRFIENFAGDRVFPLGEILELAEVPTEPGASSYKVMARLRSGETVRINGSSLIEVVAELADVLPATGAQLWMIRAVHEPQFSRPKNCAFRFHVEPIIGWQLGDKAFPEPFGPTGRDTLGERTSSAFITDGAHAWTSLHPQKINGWSGTLDDAMAAMGFELAREIDGVDWPKITDAEVLEISRLSAPATNDAETQA